MDRSVTVSSTPASRTQLTEIELKQAFDDAKRYARKSRSAATWRAYQSDWRQFEAWCVKLNLEALPATPETVSMFVASQAAAGLNPSTSSRRLCAIRLVHLGAGHASPHNALKVTEVMRGIRRDWAQPPEKKAAAVDDDIKRMADTVDSETAKGLRDRALLLFGFAGAFRRSELVALNVEDLVERDEGYKVTIRQSKTDQQGKGQVIAILRQTDSPYCPVQALKDWLTVAEIKNGALFRRMFVHDTIGKQRLSAQSVALVVKEYARRAGLDWQRYAGHSLRSGYLTSAANKRASIFKMADQSRHKSLDVLRQYVREEDLFVDHSAEQLLKPAAARAVNVAAAPVSPDVKTTTLHLHLLVENNSKFVRGKGKSLRNIEDYILPRYSARRTSDCDYEVTFKHTDEADLEEQVVALAVEMEREADLRHGYVDCDIWNEKTENSYL